MYIYTYIYMYIHTYICIVPFTSNLIHQPMDTPVATRTCCNPLPTKLPGLPAVHRPRAASAIPPRCPADERPEKIHPMGGVP